jgi:hypothetical protein
VLFYDFNTKFLQKCMCICGLFCKSDINFIMSIIHLQEHMQEPHRVSTMQKDRIAYYMAGPHNYDNPFAACISSISLPLSS